MDVFLSDSHNPIDNLAMEEALLVRCKCPRLLLYENNNAVVIGRFQNPWRECHIDAARKEGFPIIRRISGGGTVVHVRGNLNWSVITPCPLANRDENMVQMVQALASMDIAVHRTPVHDLKIGLPGIKDLRKVGGSAFRQTANSSMHHATLLVNADLKMLKNLLNVPPRKIDGGGVLSRSSPVANLADMIENLDVPAVIKTLTRYFSDRDEPFILSPQNFTGDRHFLNAKKRLDTWEWNIGKTPAFIERFNNLPGLEGKCLECGVKKGRIHSLSVDGRALDMPKLMGNKYDVRRLMDAMDCDVPAWLDKDPSGSL